MSLSTESKLDVGLAESGLEHIVGVDEVGRGCIAGPVTAGSVILHHRKLHLLSDSELDLIRDSKTLSPKQRENADKIIRSCSVSCGIGFATEREIEQLGILGAVFLAMKRSLEGHSQIQLVLVDGRDQIPHLPWEQQTIVKGDNITFCIAAASIIAKVARDRFMRNQATINPHWEFDKNFGYGTKAHLKAINKHGPCVLHRRNFAPVKNLTSPRLAFST